eukprot:2265-Heterococcus_DN1.PRE.1
MSRKSTVPSMRSCTSWKPTASTSPLLRVAMFIAVPTTVLRELRSIQHLSRPAQARLAPTSRGAALPALAHIEVHVGQLTGVAAAASAAYAVQRDVNSFEHTGYKVPTDAVLVVQVSVGLVSEGVLRFPHWLRLWRARRTVFIRVG